jgi:hypothetical protein
VVLDPVVGQEGVEIPVRPARGDADDQLGTVVGVLVEVPVMLSECAACNRTRHWFPSPESAA